MRKTPEELNKIANALNVSELWSWSRYQRYKTSPYEYYLNYIKHIAPEDDTSIYGYMGTIAHDTLEKYYSNEIKYEDMVNCFQDGWDMAEISGLKFDKSDTEKNNSISYRYYENIKHFFNNHNHIDGQSMLEEFILINVGKFLFQGYIDFMFIKDGNVIIQDWKTSSIYKGEKAEKEAGQLLLYAEGIHQKNIPYEKIKIRWNFLKYCNVTVEMKNGKSKVRQIERCKLGESLKSNAKTWLKHFGYNDVEINDYLLALIETNNIEVLPKEVQQKFIMDDCYVYIDITEEKINSLKEDIIKTIQEIKIKEKEYEETNDDTVFYDSPESVKKNSYYFANLCGYTAQQHKPYGEYLKTLEDKDNIFLNTNKNIEQEDDLEWLNSL